ncbi:hypothetical protein Tco_1178633, partial [Tanacetum coccineum]
YGKSYSDVVQWVEHTLENLRTYQMFAPSSFKYRVALEKQDQFLKIFFLLYAIPSVIEFFQAKHIVLSFTLLQLTSTMLHVLGLASVTHHHPVHDFLVKALCSSLMNQFETEHDSTWSQKKRVIIITIQSLIKVYEDKNHHTMAQRKLVNGIP